ncbi:SIS domain-containing protein [Cupriavidus sp. AU9028]|uniref:KpsF/GutQ family sugar-phosphate isomerase n=1 Tax=Cupriavidus sp. AU9028 TaxID=2871157 RepID=UPI001C974D9E|nr:KpsF/GutQ family sugar-phosphate isomerase [Cupriavidus sp. AU9028]MBY4895865.1 KpsF/GutQ family sugar-phosphate isomerase [Cupriavidus sp. AU9028]
MNTGKGLVRGLAEVGQSAAAISRGVVAEQARALAAMAQSFGTEIEAAVDMILRCRGRLIVSGMGKSGLIGRKMAATFSSTGTPSYFLHPAEALHGDLGVIRHDDVVMLISNSGETEEILRLLPSLQDFGNAIVGISSNRNSTLARHSTVFLHLPMEREVCPNNLAPTTSTLLTLALGDALAVALIQLRGFKPLDFARFHPGGSLGRKLLTRVADVMHKRIPAVHPSAPLQDAINSMTSGRLGLTVVMDGEQLAGIFTDGDLRRAIAKDPAALSRPVSHFMTANPITVTAGTRLSDAEVLMRDGNIRALIVLDDEGQVAGVLDIFDN